MTLINPSARFVLAHKTRKSDCPACGKKRFRRYVDTLTGDLLPEHVGICDRENSCEYRHTALQWIEAGGKPPDVEKMQQRPVMPPKTTSYRVPDAVVGQCLNHDENTLAQYLTIFFGRQAVLAAFDRYGVGTYAGKEVKLRGSTIFWQRDMAGEVRTGEIIMYREGRRSKEAGHHTWAHYLLTKTTAKELGVGECLFGLHLVRNWSPSAWIAIVESAKSAIILSLVYPEMLWLSSRSMDGLSLDKCMPIAGRNVILYPDAGKGLESWTAKALAIEPAMKRLVVSDIIAAMGFDDGEDLADLVVPDNYLLASGVDIFPGSIADAEQVEAVAEVRDKYAPAICALINRNPAIETLINKLELEHEKATISALA
jgi:hypothetical protein